MALVGVTMAPPVENPALETALAPLWSQLLAVAVVKKGSAHPAQGALQVQGQVATGGQVVQGAVVTVFQAVAAVGLLVILATVVQGEQ
tara:strand:- start:323 stop:586 length:264 start_codon:yes stop_codon:yes gene_type:complete